MSDTDKPTIIDQLRQQHDPNNRGFVRFAEVENPPQPVDIPKHNLRIDRRKKDNLFNLRNMPADAPERMPSLRTVERNHIIAVVAACENDRERAAEILGICRRTLEYKLGAYVKVGKSSVKK